VVACLVKAVFDVRPSVGFLQRFGGRQNPRLIENLPDQKTKPGGRRLTKAKEIDLRFGQTAYR
jgi:hypothetical protein